MSRASAAKKRAAASDQAGEHPWAAQTARQKRAAEWRERWKLLQAAVKLMVAAAAFYFFFGW